MCICTIGIIVQLCRTVNPTQHPSLRTSPRTGAATHLRNVPKGVFSKYTLAHPPKDLFYHDEKTDRRSSGRCHVKIFTIVRCIMLTKYLILQKQNHTMDDTRFGGRSVALELLIPRSFTLARETPLQRCKSGEKTPQH